MQRVPFILAAALLLVREASCSHAGQVSLGLYPGYVPANPQISPSGTLYIDEVQGSNMIRIRGVMAGLIGSGQWHIHTGYSCDAAGGHYFPNMATDPWNKVTYTSNNMHVTSVDKSMPFFSLMGVNPVLGRTVVVHDASGVKVACGRAPG